MTTVIDHAIAIPTRPANVWEIVRDIQKNAIWQPDSQRVQFLINNKQGRGTRWRNTTPSGKEQVYEITAWYEGLGYEYRIVDGSNYPKNRGVIRLQEAPEGTIVQWTFSYEIGGMFGQLRNNISMKGRIDKQVVQGLRNLYAHIKDLKADELLTPEESKSYLKEAPNVQERASYQPRYPSKIASQEIPAVNISEDEDALFKPPAQVQPTAVSPTIDEPPVTDEDTRPNPAVQSPTADIPQPMPTTEPDFLKAMPDPLPPSATPKDEPKTPAIQANKPEEETAPATTFTETTDFSETLPGGLVEDASAEESNMPVAEPPKATVEPLTDDRDYSKLDTSQISVFEIFGLDKPSETEQVKPIETTGSKAEPLPETPPKIETPSRSSVTTDETFADKTPIVPDVSPEAPSGRRRGLRARLRRRLTNVRIPK